MMNPFAWEHTSDILERVKAQQRHILQQQQIHIIETISNNIYIDTEDQYITNNENINTASQVYNDYKEVIKNLFTPRTCVHCNVIYETMQNYQEYTCMFHPGRQGLNSRGDYVYLCCDSPLSQGTLGCIKSMHSATQQGWDLIIQNMQFSKIPIDLIESNILLFNKKMIMRKNNVSYSFATNILQLLTKNSL